MNKQPPQFFLKFLRWFCHPELIRPIEGDLMELYDERVEELGKRKADKMFRKDVLLLFRKDIIKPASGTYTLTNYGMIKNYLKVGYRNLIRNKSHAYINIGGLSIAITVFILIGLWINDEFSVNHNHENYERTAMVLKKRTFNGDTQVRYALPIPIVEELRTTYGEDLKYVMVSSWQGSSLVDTNDKQLHLEGNYMSADAPKLLGLKMIEGTRESLNDKFSVIISEQAAKSLFGSENAIGKELTIDGEVTMTVTGIYAELPPLSSFYGLTFIGNFDGYATSQDWIVRAKENAYWGSNFCRVYVQLADHASFEGVNEKIEKVIYDHIGDRGKQSDPKAFLHPMDDWHLRSNWEQGVQSGGAIKYVWLFGAIGVFVLLLACINFMNLSTAQAERRAKEVGIRKSLGSLRSQLISQFLVESFLIVLLAFTLSIFVVNLLLPYFNILADKQISFPYAEPNFWMSASLFIAFTSIIAASYPAFYLSGFKPIGVLKGTFRSGKSSGRFRNSLVVVQFVVSITLIAGTIIVYQQISHSKSRPMGYENKNLLSVNSSAQAFIGKHKILQDELLKSGAALAMSQSSSPLTEVNSTYAGFDWEGKDPDLVTNFVFTYVTPEFGKTVRWNIQSGRDFTYQKSDEKAFVLNRSAADFIGLPDLVGKSIQWKDETYRVIAIVDDLITDSPFQQPKPAIYATNMDEVWWMQIRLNDQQPLSASIDQIENVFEEVLPNVPFNFEFVTQVHFQKFSAISRIGKLAGIFTFLAILISALGLFGLASYTVERKTKEIGIRKVLGAKAVKLVLSLSWQYAKMVIIASSIAVPISYFMGNRWLESFAFRINLEWWFFALSSLIAVVIAGISVSSKTIRAVRINPVESLRDE